MQKVDLLMWTFNGEATLDSVLDRINKVVPKENIGKKIIVDDHSIDETKNIATSRGWKSIDNFGSGISDGANTALSQVTSDFFCSFEQDIILANDWWIKIAVPFFNSNFSASSGMRFPSQPKGATTLFKYVAKKYRGEQLSPWLKNRESNAFTLGKTLDNTIYKTKIIREVGGFPYMKVNAGVDTLLAWKLEKYGFKWKVDYNVRSVHIRKGLSDELNHQKWYGTQTRNIWEAMKIIGVKPSSTIRNIMLKLFLAPFSGVFVAVKTKEASIVYIHPLIRFYNTWGFLIGPQKTKYYKCGNCGEITSQVKFDLSTKKYVCSLCKQIGDKEIIWVH
jgi:glycosyltransferase involved in cell wall biosynthesis